MSNMNSFFSFISDAYKGIYQLTNIGFSQIEVDAEHAEKDIFQDLYETRADFFRDDTPTKAE